MVALLTSVRNSPCFGGLRRTKTCHWQLFARPSVFLRYFLHAAKSTNPFPRREFRGFANLESAHQNNNFPLTKLNPFETFRFAESLSLPGRHTSCAFSALRRLFPTFCKVQKVGQKTLKLSYGKFVPAGTAHSVCFLVLFADAKRTRTPPP